MSIVEDNVETYIKAWRDLHNSNLTEGCLGWLGLTKREKSSAVDRFKSEFSKDEQRAIEDFLNEPRGWGPPLDWETVTVNSPERFRDGDDEKEDKNNAVL